MPLPSVNPELIDQALAKFDQEERATPQWQDWETRQNYKYAIEKNGRLYPPRKSSPWRRECLTHPSAVVQKPTAICAGTGFGLRL